MADQNRPAPAPVDQQRQDGARLILERGNGARRPALAESGPVDGDELEAFRHIRQIVGPGAGAPRRAVDEDDPAAHGIPRALGEHGDVEGRADPVGLRLQAVDLVRTGGRPRNGAGRERAHEERHGKKPRESLS